MAKKTQGMTFIEHMGELRKRLIWIIIVTVICAGIGFTFSEAFLELLTIPADEDNLHILAPAEAFLTQLKLAIISGVAFAFPVILYNIIAFLLPALEKHEKRYLFIALPFALILFIVGVMFAYSVILPIAYRFFMGFVENGQLSATISLRSYVSFAIGLIIPFGIVFQLPLVVMIMTQLGILSPSFLRTYRKIAVLIVFALGALLTPPDLISQGLMAGPLLLLYELSILISHVVYKKRKKRLDLN